MVLDRTESIGHNLFNKMKILAADLTDRYRGNYNNGLDQDEILIFFY